MYNYDWGTKAENQKHYKQDYAPTIDLTRVDNIPIGMFVGSKDDLGDSNDAKWASEQMKSVAHYQEILAGHASFMVGKDMSYFKDVLTFVQKYSPLSE